MQNRHCCSYSCTCHVFQICARNCARSLSRPKLHTELLTTHIDIRVVRTVRSHLESAAAPHTTGCPFLKWTTGTDAVRPQSHYQLHQLNSKNKTDEQTKMNFSQQTFIRNGRWVWGLFLEGLQDDLLNQKILEHCSEMRTKADPLKCDEPDREQFMHITCTVTGATQNFSLGIGGKADSEGKFNVCLILKKICYRNRGTLTVLATAFIHI